MRLPYLYNVVNYAFDFVALTSKQMRIDESHALRHSMDVFHLANRIYHKEVDIAPYLKQQFRVIGVSAILHDMCDHKYMDEQEGVEKLCKHMKPMLENHELDAFANIVTTMSYSKVQQKGFPTNLGEYTRAYHIVREADLLSAYNVERCLIYQMQRKDFNYADSIYKVIELFQNRVLTYREQDLFLTEFGKEHSLVLHEKAVSDLKDLEELYTHML